MQIHAGIQQPDNVQAGTVAGDVPDPVIERKNGHHHPNAPVVPIIRRAAAAGQAQAKQRCGQENGQKTLHICTGSFPPQAAQTP